MCSDPRAIEIRVESETTVAPLTSLPLDSLPAEPAGPASGVVNTFRQLGCSPAVGAVIASQGQFVTGMRIGLAAAAALVTISAIATVGLRAPSNRAV